MFLYSSVDIKVGGDSAVGEDGASLSEHLVQQVMAKLANAYLDNLTPKSQADFERFQLYLQETRRLIVGEVQRGSLLITVRCTSLEILENLWQAYKSGELNEAAERYLITDELLKEYELRELKLITVIDEEEYMRCKEELTDLEGNLMVASFSLGGWVARDMAWWLLSTPTLHGWGRSRADLKIAPHSQLAWWKYPTWLDLVFTCNNLHIIRW